LDLLTIATVVDDAIRFVSSKTNENIRSSNEESNEPDYDEDRDQLEEEHEDEPRKATTRNTVF